MAFMLHDHTHMTRESTLEEKIKSDIDPRLAVAEVL